ncbi:hypothetical protein Ddye_029420 [Dipteronia dyeriana]|uniref:DUF7875 domain-containing protein n=1 Tax=Dipteronia dyeriana TaxID=168575 RepID=A0AAD9TFH9_9ROSI|nr:hypothetical protein Ddye_029420 [Dipteronia dyeriana]
MVLRCMLGFSDGELMRLDAKPCSRLMRQTAGIFTVEEHWDSGFFVDSIMVLELQCLEVSDGQIAELLP